MDTGHFSRKTWILSGRLTFCASLVCPLSSIKELQHGSGNFTAVMEQQTHQLDQARDAEESELCTIFIKLEFLHEKDPENSENSAIL